MKSRIALGLAFAALLWATSLAAEQGAQGFALGGTIESRPFARYALSSADADPGLSYGSETGLSLELNASGGRARAAASIEAALLTGAAASDAWAVAATGLAEEGMLIVPAYGALAAPGCLLEARVRSLYVKVDYDWLSLTAGRQVVNYARGALWSPTDIFTELDLTGLSPVRRGTDALRLSFPLSETGAFDLVAAPTSDMSLGRYAARLSGFIPGIGEGGVDGALIACRDGSGADGKGPGWNFGADLKGDLVAGIDAAALYTLPDSGAGWLRSSGGADWSSGDFVVAAEYYYNGGGGAADVNAPGAHNAYASLSWKASDFVVLAANCVAGLSEQSCVAIFSASIDAAQNADILAYARLGYAKSGAEWAAPMEAGVQMKVKF